jgi:ribosomal protein S18 acetylase RimI-like enzyme
MALRALSDRCEIAEFVRRDPAYHVYELGDLDSALFPHTKFWGFGEPLRAICMLYCKSDPPTLICLGRNDPGAAGELLSALSKTLPRPLYAHVTPGLDASLPAPRQSHERHWKMALTTPERARALDRGEVERLGPQHRVELSALYGRSSADSWFSEWTLESGFYFGIRSRGLLIAAAGVHVASIEQRVAAIGNVATDPAHRGKGLATRVTAASSVALLEHVDHIGLNVQSDNRAAIACYEKLGFEKIAEYDELAVLA